MSSFVISGRLMELAQPKKSDKKYVKPRESPWKVNPNALTAVCSHRISVLAVPRPSAPGYQEPRPLGTNVVRGTKLCLTTPRVVVLAQPPTRKCNGKVELRPKEQVICVSALGKVSERILELAKPRPLPPDSILDSSGFKQINRSTDRLISSRLMELSQPKHLDKRYIYPRDPEWKVTNTALNAVCSHRVSVLAVPKACPIEYREPRPVETNSLRGTKLVLTTPRIVVLAQPVTRKSRGRVELRPKEQVICMSTLGKVSERIVQLAKPKHLPPDYIPSQPVLRPVSESARYVIPTPRIVELSKPLTRKIIIDKWDPFGISTSSQKAVATPRVLELARPKKHHQ